MEFPDEEALRRWFHANGLPRDTRLAFDRHRLSLPAWRSPPPSRQRGWAFAAVALATFAIGVGVLRVRPPTPSPTSHRQALSLAVFSGSGAGIPDDPLWHGWHGDGRRLAFLEHAWQERQDIRALVRPTPSPSFSPALQLGFDTGLLVTITPYYRARGNALFRSASEVVVTEPGRRPELVRSRLLTTVLDGAWPGFKPGPRPTVSLAGGGRLTVRGSGAVGSRVTIYATPVYGDNIGGGPMQPGSFPVATVVSLDGEYRWAGTVHLPKGYRVFHPVRAWGLSIDVHPFPRFPHLGGEIMLGAPDGAIPPVTPSRVRTPTDALVALTEARPPNPFPFWSSRAGIWKVSWVTRGGLHAEGTEAITAWAGTFWNVALERTELGVDVTLTYREGSRRPVTYRESWTVDPTGTWTLTQRTGRPPGPVVRVLTVRRIPLQGLKVPVSSATTSKPMPTGGTSSLKGH